MCIIIMSATYQVQRLLPDSGDERVCLFFFKLVSDVGNNCIINLEPL